MKIQFASSLLGLAVFQGSVVPIESSMASEASPSLSARVSTLENRTPSFALSGILINRYDQITSSDGTNLTPMRIYAAINADAEVSPRLNFYTRFAMSKFVNSIIDQRQGAVPSSINASRQEAGPAVFVERAFLNYKILPTLGIAIGRLPTNYGPPYQLYDELAKQGAYPMLGYSGQLDGVALSYGFSELLPVGSKLALRGIISPLTANGEDNLDSAKVPRLAGALSATTSPAYRTTMPIYSVIADYENTKNSIADKLATTFQYVTLSHVQIGDIVRRGTDLGALNTNGIPSTTGIVFGGSNLNFGAKTFTFYQEANGIANTGLSIALTYYHSISESEGLTETNPAIGTASPLLAGRGYMTDGTSGKRSGDAVLVTSTYKIPLASLNLPLLGLELFHGSRYHQYFNSNTDDLSGLYNTRGKVLHAWYT